MSRIAQPIGMSIAQQFADIVQIMTANGVHPQIAAALRVGARIAIEALVARHPPAASAATTLLAEMNDTADALSDEAAS